MMPAVAYAGPAIEGAIWVYPFEPYDDGGTTKWDVDANAWANYADGLWYEIDVWANGNSNHGEGYVSGNHWSTTLSTNGLGAGDYQASLELWDDSSHANSQLKAIWNFSLWRISLTSNGICCCSIFNR